MWNQWVMFMGNQYVIKSIQWTINNTDETSMSLTGISISHSLIITNNQWLIHWLLIDHPLVSTCNWCHWPLISYVWLYRSYLPISRAIFWEILTSICQIMSKQGGSAHSREFDRFYFFSDVKIKQFKENVIQIPRSACSQVPSNKTQQTRDKLKLLVTGLL